MDSQLWLCNEVWACLDNHDLLRWQVVCKQWNDGLGHMPAFVAAELGSIRLLSRLPAHVLAMPGPRGESPCEHAIGESTSRWFATNVVAARDIYSERLHELVTKGYSTVIKVIFENMSEVQKREALSQKDHNSDTLADIAARNNHIAMLAAFPAHCIPADSCLSASTESTSRWFAQNTPAAKEIYSKRLHELVGKRYVTVIKVIFENMREQQRREALSRRDRQGDTLADIAARNNHVAMLAAFPAHRIPADSCLSASNESTSRWFAQNVPAAKEIYSERLHEMVGKGYDTVIKVIFENMREQQRREALSRRDRQGDTLADVAERIRSLQMLDALGLPH